MRSYEFRLRSICVPPYIFKCLFLFGNENKIMRMMHAKSYYNNDVKIPLLYIHLICFQNVYSILNNANCFLLLSTQLMRNGSIYARYSSHLRRQAICVCTSLWFTKNQLWFEFNFYNFSLHPSHFNSNEKQIQYLCNC